MYVSLENLLNFLFCYPYFNYLRHIFTILMDSRNMAFGLKCPCRCLNSSTPVSVIPNGTLIASAAIIQNVNLVPYLTYLTLPLKSPSCSFLRISFYITNVTGMLSGTNTSALTVNVLTEVLQVVKAWAKFTEN